MPWRPNHNSCAGLHVYSPFSITICQFPVVHIVLQKWSLSFLNWCPGGCCHITEIFRCSSDLLRWCTVFHQHDFFQVLSWVEETFSVVFDSWTRRDCNLIFPSVFSTLAALWISNILDGWLPKMFLVKLLSGFWKSEKNFFSVVIFKFWCWSWNYDFF